MNRKQFILTVWEKGIKPALLMAVIFFCLKFLYHVFSENGSERFIIILALILGVLFALSYLASLAFISLFTKINSGLPEPVKPWVRKAGKFLNYMAPFIMGIIIYHFWQEDWQSAAFVIGILLIDRLVEMIQKGKQEFEKETT